MNVLLWIKDYVKAHINVHKARHQEEENDKGKCAFAQDARNLIHDINEHSHCKHKKFLWH